MYAVIERLGTEWRCVAINEHKEYATKWRDCLLSDGKVAEICKINRSDILRAAERIMSE